MELTRLPADSDTLSCLQKPHLRPALPGNPDPHAEFFRDIIDIMVLGTDTLTPWMREVVIIPRFRRILQEGVVQCFARCNPFDRFRLQELLDQVEGVGDVSVMRLF